MSIYSSLLGSQDGGNAKCDCTIYPFSPEPPCFRLCTARYLALANREDLVRAGVSSHVAAQIEVIPLEARPRSLERYAEVLPSPSFQQLLIEVESIRPRAFQHLRTTYEQRGQNVNSPWDELRDEVKA